MLRKENVTNAKTKDAIVMLEGHELDIEVKSNIHIRIIDYASNEWDLWPTTGKWKEVRGDKSGIGIKNLIRTMNIEYDVTPSN